MEFEKHCKEWALFLLVLDPFPLLLVKVILLSWGESSPQPPALCASVGLICFPEPEGAWELVLANQNDPGTLLELLGRRALCVWLLFSLRREAWRWCHHLGHCCGDSKNGASIDRRVCVCVKGREAESETGRYLITSFGVLAWSQDGWLLAFESM